MKAALLLLALLTGCASLPAGVSMSAGEAEACKRETCTVWTQEELLGLAKQIFKRGFDAGKQAGKGDI